MRGVCDSRLWGNSKSLQVGPTLGPTRITFSEIARIEAPRPTTWNVFGRLANNGGTGPFDPGDLAGGTFVWELLIGVGQIQVPLLFPVAGAGVPAVPNVDGSFYFQAFGLPAQWVSARLEFFGAVAVGGLWSVDTWAVPLGTFFGEAEGFAHGK